GVFAAWPRKYIGAIVVALTRFQKLDDRQTDGTDRLSLLAFGEAKATSIDIDFIPFEIDNLTASAARKCDLPNDIDGRAELLDLRSGLEHAAKNSILAAVEAARADIVFGAFDAMRGIAVDDAEIDGIS